LNNENNKKKSFFLKVDFLIKIKNGNLIRETNESIEKSTNKAKYTKIKLKV